MAKVAGRKKRIIGTTAALVAIGGGAAFAYWSATGTHNTTASAGKSANFVVTSKIAGDPLSPNGPVQVATFTVNNPGSGVQELKSIKVSVADSKGTPWVSGDGCSYEDFAVGTPSFDRTQIEPGKSVTGTVSLQMINRPTVNQDGCQNASVPLHFEAS